MRQVEEEGSMLSITDRRDYVLQELILSLWLTAGGGTKDFKDRSCNNTESMLDQPTASRLGPD